MLEIIGPHIQEDSRNGMHRRHNYFSLVKQLGEMDYFEKHLQQIQATLRSPTHPMTIVRETLLRMGFTGKVSELAPGLHFTFAHPFDNVAVQYTEDKRIQQRIVGGIIFARGAKQPKYEECSSLLAGVAITTDEQTSHDRFTLTFATKRQEFRDNDITAYPFPDGMEREYIAGNLQYSDTDMRVQITTHSPHALQSLQTAMRTPSRVQTDNISLEDATGALLSHFFIKTPNYHPSYFSRFYRPDSFVRDVTTGK